MSRSRVGLGVVLVALLLAGCYGSVRDGTVGDPGEDYSGAADIDLAGVDYRTATTRVFQRFHQPPASGTLGFLLSEWSVSTDGDTNPEFRVSIGGLGVPDPDQWTVRRLAAQGSTVVCQGQAPGGGYDGDRTISITAPTSCLATGGALADTVRVSAANDAHRSGNDHTDWTDQVTRD